MASVASELIEEVTLHAQSDSLEDAREICADGTYFPNNLRISLLWFSYFLSDTRTTTPYSKTSAIVNRFVIIIIIIIIIT